jgi:serine/threonine protein phosphatase PrpC
MKTDLFNFEFSAGSALDIGKRRITNMDKVINCAGLGFFAVADGMGGLANGGKTSEILTGTVPGFVVTIAEEYRIKKADPEKIGEALKERVRLISDHVFRTSNTQDHITFGSTLCCVWLAGEKAAFVNLGDSRGLLLHKGETELRQITCDHNLAGELYRAGELTKEQAKHHPASSELIQFVGMPPPACPDCFIEDVTPGDKILLCSDGLYDMLDDPALVQMMNLPEEPDKICACLVDAANKAGGADNISVVYIRIEGE